VRPAVVIRRATEGDREAIEAMFGRCSAESRYRRFLSPQLVMPAGYLARVLAGTSTEETWVGVVGGVDGRVVALASLARRGPEAELALLVEDAWQRQGIGTSLLRMLARRATVTGVPRLTALVLSESRHVLRMLVTVLGPTSVRMEGSVTHVTIDRWSGAPVG
jgi:GNAT superfamily N-acetyltransferase